VVDGRVKEWVLGVMGGQGPGSGIAGMQAACSSRESERNGF
jgi:hypothetical protein